MVEREERPKSGRSSCFGACLAFEASFLSLVLARFQLGAWSLETASEKKHLHINRMKRTIHFLPLLRPVSAVKSHAERERERNTQAAGRTGPKMWTLAFGIKSGLPLITMLAGRSVLRAIVVSALVKTPRAPRRTKELLNWRRRQWARRRRSAGSARRAPNFDCRSSKFEFRISNVACRRRIHFNSLWFVRAELDPYRATNAPIWPPVANRTTTNKSGPFVRSICWFVCSPV